MVRWPARVLIVVALCALVATPVPVPIATAVPEPPEPCTNQTAPPPPVDTSEEPPPGEPSPRPLPVPEEPVGGQRMAECKRVIPAGESPPKRVRPASWLIADIDSGDVLAAKDPHGRHRPASLIKVLLALAVIDELPADTEIQATRYDAEQECTCLGVRAYQKYSVQDLFTGLLIRSGNDAAHTLGTALGGPDESLRKMNALAEGLGATDTRAASASGLDAPGMMSSAYDMALIFRAAMQQPRFTEAIRTESMRFRTHRKKPPDTIYNDNRLLGRYDGFLGGKTGFTDSSRHTYVGAAERDGRRLAVVLMRAEQDPYPVVDQAERLLDYGYKLIRKGTEPVGELIDPPDGVADADDAADDGGNADGGDDESPEGEAEAAASETDDDDRGNTVELAVLAVLAVALAGAFWLRRRTQRG